MMWMALWLDVVDSQAAVPVYAAELAVDSESIAYCVVAVR